MCREIGSESGESLGAWRNQRGGDFLWLLEAKVKKECGKRNSIGARISR